MNRRRTTVVLLAALLSLGATACGGDESVGDEGLLEGTDGDAGARLGETTTTVASDPGAAPVETTAPPATAPPATAPPAAAPPATAPPATAPPATQPPPPPQQEQATLEIAIGSDTTAGGQFQPRVGQVFVGSIIRFKNTDSVPRSVKADDGTFDSGPIAPGGAFEYAASSAGVFNYSDGTRPYAVGSLEVYAR